MGGLHIIIGEDDFLVAEAARKVVGDGVGLEVIDSMNATNADLQLADLRAADASFSTPPFLDPKKTTWWKNVGFLPQGGKGGCSQDVREALEKFARKLVSLPLAENQTFLLTGPRLLMTSVFAKTLKPAAEIITFAAGRGRDVAEAARGHAMDFASEAGFSFAPGALEAFIARVGTDTRSLQSEVCKMRDYLGGERKTATAEDVAAIASPGVGAEAEIWSVTDALGARKLAQTLAALAPFEQENGFAVLMTTVLERFFRQLTELKDAQTRGMLDRATEGMSPWIVRKNTAFLRNWTLRELRVARYRFLKLREAAVSSAGSSSGSVDMRVVMEVVRACRR